MPFSSYFLLGYFGDMSMFQKQQGWPSPVNTACNLNQLILNCSASNHDWFIIAMFCSFPFLSANDLSFSSGGSEAICPGWPAVWWVPGHTLWGQVCTLFLCQCHLSAVLLWILLGSHTFACRARVPQAPGEGGRRPASPYLLPLELTQHTGWLT